MAQGWDHSDVVVLQVNLVKLLQVLQLLEADVVVRKIDTAQVLKVAQIFLDYFHDVLRVQFGLNSLMRKLDPARVKDQETVQQFTVPLLQGLGTIYQLIWYVAFCNHLWSFLGKLETSFSLYRVNDSIDSMLGHLVRDSCLLLTFLHL